MNPKTFAAMRAKAARRIEFKSVGLELKELTEDGSFAGYAAVFGNVDAYSDIIESGAFDKTIAEHPVVPILHQHDIYEIVGVSTLIEPDEFGLFVNGKLVLEVERARADYALMRAKALNGLSIGYETIKQDLERVDENTYIRRLKEIKLWEFSPVTFPANELATITDIKAFLTHLRDASLDDVRQAFEADELGSALVADLKEGRVLSEASRLLVEHAIEALQALLTSAAIEREEEAAEETEEPDNKALSTLTDALRQITSPNKE